LSGVGEALIATTTTADLRTRRSEVVKQHIDAGNRHDPDGVVASFHPPFYDIPWFEEAGQVNGPEAVRDLWPELIAGFPDAHIAPWPLQQRPSGATPWSAS